MELKNINKQQLAAWFLQDWPARFSYERCLERLEMMIQDAAAEDPSDEVEEYEQTADGNYRKTGATFPINPPCVSPYWIFRALATRRYRRFLKLPENSRKAELKRIIAKRRNQQKEGAA